MKVLTHRSRYIEPTIMPKFRAGSSSAAEATQTALITQSAEESSVMPKMPTFGPTKLKIIRPKIMLCPQPLEVGARKD